jgi:hypothetical protein
VAPFELFPFLSEVIPDLELFLDSINSAENITLVAEPKLNQLVSLSLLEASFLEKGMLYHRKLVDDINQYVPNEKNLSIYFKDTKIINNSVLVISSKEINVYLGQNKTARVGKLDVVGMATCLSLMIGDERIFDLLPLILAGNWLRESLDFTYDPVFTLLRDYLQKNGIISVVSIAEVIEPDLIELPGIDSNKLDLLRNEWSKIDLNEQSERLSLVARPLLTSTIGVARLEELMWHRVIKSNWNIDLASQCSRVQRELKSSSQKLVSASRLIDQIIRSGKLT